MSKEMLAMLIVFGITGFLHLTASVLLSYFGGKGWHIARQKKSWFWQIVWITALLVPTIELATLVFTTLAVIMTITGLWQASPLQTLTVIASSGFMTPAIPQFLALFSNPLIAWASLIDVLIGSLAVITFLVLRGPLSIEFRS